MKRRGFLGALLGLVVSPSAALRGASGNPVPVPVVDWRVVQVRRRMRELKRDMEWALLNR